MRDGDDGQEGYGDTKLVKFGYDDFRKLVQGERKTSRFFVTSTDLVVLSFSRKAKFGQFYHIPIEQVVADFHAAENLKDLCNAYHGTRKTIWKMLEQLGLSPWERVIRDYQTRHSLEGVAQRHGLKPSTLSKELKARGIPMRSGRLPKQFSDNEVELAMQDNPSVNELSRRLECSWETAKKQRSKWKAGDNSK